MPPTSPRLILASASPRRRDLMSGLGLEFAVRPVDIDESQRPGEPPMDYVARLAREKAAHHLGDGELVLAADTIVVLDGELLGKPGDPAEARRMLARLAGRNHTVHTGVELAEPRRAARAVATTEVRLSPIDAETIAWYVDTGEPLDKAGSYGAQGLGALFVEHFDGTYGNVIGLPLHSVRALFGELGYDIRDFRR